MAGRDELWRVRVDLFAQDGDSSRVACAASQLRVALVGIGQDPEVAADQGHGVADRPVVGLLFWLRASDVGSAANLSYELAIKAGMECGVGPDLYDLTLVPAKAFVLPAAAHDPPMPD